MITHVVLFKLKEQSEEARERVKALLSSMEGRIGELRHLEVGTDIVRSERSYDLALITRFDSLEDLKSYQGHPYHVDEVLAHLKDACSAVVAVDYETP